MVDANVEAGLGQVFVGDIPPSRARSAGDRRLSFQLRSLGPNPSAVSLRVVSRMWA